jgi:hypothetical protein
LISSNYKYYNFIYKIFIILFVIIIITNIETLFLIKTDEITDRTNYHNYVKSSEDHFNSIVSNTIYLNFVQEPLFKIFIYLISSLQLSSENTIKLLIAITLIIYFYTTIKKANVPLIWCIIFLFTPVLLPNYIMTLRQGFATSIFLLIYYSFNKKIKYLSLMLPLIHYLFYIVTPIFLFSKTKIHKPKSAIFIFFIISLLFSLLILNGPSQVLNQLAGSYIENKMDGFGFAFIFWLIILFLFINEGTYFLIKNIFEVLCLVFYLGSVLFFPPISRELQAVSILILISGLSLTKKNIIIFKTMIFAFFLYQIISFLILGTLGSMYHPDPVS